MTNEMLMERKSKIWEMIADDRDYEAFGAARQLDSDAPDSVNYILGFCYGHGMGTEADPEKAIAYLKRAVHTEEDPSDVAESWILGGVLYMSAEMYEEADNWFSEAEKMGKKEATAYLGMVYALAGIDMRNAACATLDSQEYAATNELAVDFISHSMQKYFKCLGDAPEEMSKAHCVMLARMAEMMVNMACRGELAVELTDAEGIAGHLSNAVRIGQSKAAGKDREEWFEIAVDACEGIERSGQPAIAELIRSLCNLYVSRHTHSAEAYFRADWHFKRAQCFLSKLDEEEREDIMSTFGDVYNEYAAMMKKYGRTVENMMRNGRHPDISVSYAPGEAPDVMSCQSYKEALIALHNTPPKAASGIDGIISKIMRFFGKE
ncbi:MAG: SEL1-like repeat protein [Oscillospiraceae bacterium]|nr:SEL1-like repeat protein [Oscillospiraceae bacterium]